MENVKKFYRLHWCFWSGDVVRLACAAAGSARRGVAPRLEDCVLSIVSPSKFFYFFLL